MDKWMVGWMSRWTEGDQSMEGWMIGHAYGRRTKIWMVRWTRGQTVGWNRQKNKQTGRQIDRQNGVQWC